MDVDHPDAQPRGGPNRAGHGRRDVVKLQIEKDAIAACRELGRQRRTLAREQTTADLETTDCAAQSIRKHARVRDGIDVECD
jgi:hypothetical protein